MKFKQINPVRKIGMMLLFLFFYTLSIGNALRIGEYYQLFFYAAIVVAMILFFVEKNALKQYFHYYFWILSFILLQVISLTYTINSDHGLQLLSNMFKILLKCTTVVIIVRDFNGVKRLLKGFAFLGGALFFTLFITDNFAETFRLGTDLNGNANSFALYVMVFSLGALYFIFESKELINKLVYLALLGLDMYMLFMSGGRKFLLFDLVFVFVSVLARGNKISIKRFLFAVITVGVVAFFGYYVIFNIPVFYNSIGVRFEGLFSSQGAVGVDDQYNLFKTAWQAFIKKPIFGWGIGGYQQYSFVSRGVYFYSHSNYFELLANFGIVGFLIYYSQYVYCFRKMLKYRRSREFTLYMPLLTAICVIDVFSVTFNQTAFIPLFIMLISGFSSMRKYQNSKWCLSDEK